MSWTPVHLPGEYPPPAGAYSPAVRAGNLIFVSGQLPRDPRTRQVVGTDVAGQTRQVFANIDVILSAAYREVMTPPYPARAAVGAQLHGALVEVSVIAQAP